MTFTVIKKKGYDQAEVDGHIQKLTQDYEAKLAEQKNRIFELKDKLAKREQELEESKSHYDLIAKTLIEAVKRAEEIDKLAEARYREEIQHLKVFHEKWVKYYNRLIQKYPADEELRSVRDFNNKMRDILNGNTAEKLELERFYDSEYKRITKLEKQRRDKFEEELLDSEPQQAAKPTAKSPAAGFSYDEALNPKEGLEQILKDLGIYEG
ncbi:MAG: DivIVA domain-containing protein [Clostridiales bacterium]|jgi:cell division septum initiation protein DivIVA|nr:DivIVA domain-containing protein [Clostridiales bacterium]